jgi:tetratricopeptide (TPR) repeat protein
VSAPVSPPASGTAPARGRRAFWLASAVLVVLFAAGGAWWWLSRREKPPEPPLPPDITDPEVRKVVEQGRAKVLAEPDSAAAWGQYGMLLLGNLFDRDADACFARAAELGPGDPRWPHGRALIALKRRPEQAEELLRRAAGLGDPEYSAVANLTLAETLLERREIDAATELFTRELAAGGVGAARANFGLAMAAVARGDEAAAADRFAAVRNSPYCRKQAVSQLAAITLARGQAAEARRLEKEARELPPDHPWPDPILDAVLELQVGQRGRSRRIDRYEEVGRFDDALAEYMAQLAVERTPKLLTGAAVNLARLAKFDPAKYDEAAALLREAVQLDPKHPQARYTLALVQFNRAALLVGENPDSEEAKRLFREVVEEATRATELKPDYAEAHLFAGLSLHQLREPKAAIERYHRGLVARPDDFMLHLSLGQVLAETGDETGARKHLEAARELEPEDPRPAQELAKLKK